jgi:hypothetical protein
MNPLLAAALAAAFGLALSAPSSAQGDKPLLAQAGGGSSGAAQPGSYPPGSIPPGAPSTAATAADRETGAASRTNPSDMNTPSAAGGASADRFSELDRNHDGFLSRDEARNASELDTRFSELDQNNDGKLSREEYDALKRERK